MELDLALLQLLRQRILTLRQLFVLTLELIHALARQ